jgi:hypothetical protein
MADKNENIAQARLFLRLLGPSWLSLGISAVLVILLMGRLVLEQIRSGLGPGAAVLQTIADSGSTFLASHSLSSTNTVVQDLPVFVLWACVGAIVYFLVIDSARLLGEVGELKRQMGYVHSDRRALTWDYAERLGIRLLGLLLLFVSFMLILKMSLPYALATAVTVGTSFGPSSLLFAVVGALLLLISLHLFVVSLRLLLLRTRIIAES